jgi:hypothetical protein
MGVERIRVGSTQDFDGKEYGMKECAFKDDLKVLLVKVDGGFTALASKCSHYGGPLAGGKCNSDLRYDEPTTDMRAQVSSPRQVRVCATYVDLQILTLESAVI